MAAVETVLIVGGGIAGLTLGRALRSQGFAVDFIERSPVWRAEGGGIAVQPNGMRMLCALGLDSAVEGEGARIRCWRFCDEAGEILSESDLDALWGDIGPFIGIERMRLQQILVAGAEDMFCRLGISIRSLTRDSDRVSVAFTDGSSGSYDLVVGADGISSIVRSLALGTRLPAYTGGMAWRSIAPICPRRLTTLQFHLGEGCFFGLCPGDRGGDPRLRPAVRPQAERLHAAVESKSARFRARRRAIGKSRRQRPGCRRWTGSVPQIAVRTSPVKGSRPRLPSHISAMPI